MEKLVRKTLVICFLLVMAASASFAQSREHLVGVTYRTSDLQLCNGDLGEFYKQYTNQTSSSDVFFENLHVYKNKKDFYLLAKEQNSDRVYAFSLVRHGNGLYLNTKDHVHITNKGLAVLTSLLQNETARLSCSDCLETVIASVR